MHIGIAMFPTDAAIRPYDLARAVEERGFESVWFPEHSHIPTSRRTEWPGAGRLPERYSRTLDQFVALTAAATATSRLALGTGITLVAQRDPIWLAKEVASLDFLSGGRLLFGIGYGWNREEMAHHGVDFGQRRAVVREKVLAMKALWTEHEASYLGDHVRLEASWAYPKPVQKPHPPVILGGAAGPKTFAAVAEFCDGWMPFAGRGSLAEQIVALRRAAAAAGRDPDTIEIGVFGGGSDPRSIAALAAAGVSRLVLALPSAPADRVLPRLDRFARLLTELD